MRRRVAVGVAGAVIVAGSVAAGMSIAGSDSLPAERQVADFVVAEPVTAVARGSATAPRRARKRKPTINFLYSGRPLVPAEGKGLVQPIRCPKSVGNPIGGGARTSQGIVIAYLSRAHPTTAVRPRRTYFVGVEDVSGNNPDESGALVEVQCAKNMVVRP